MKTVLVILALLVCASAVYAVGDQAYLGMFVETSVTKMAGMPMPKLPAGMDMSMLAKVPGMEQMMGMGAPRRKLDVRLWSPGIAPANAFASIAAPAGLKEGAKLDLNIYRPTAEENKGEVKGGPGSPSAQIEMTIKYYWGSSATVKPGQPKVITFGSLTPDQKRRMNDTSSKSRASGSYFYKPDWTTAYWPTKKQTGMIDKEAVLPGAYALTTNYCGNVTIECPTNVDFLAGIEMTSPDLEEQPDLAKALEFEWKPIPNLLGSHASIFGMEGEKTIIMWSSSEIWSESMMSADWGFLQMAEVRKFVTDTIMMEGDRTNVIVPAGIFKACNMANMMMVGYGPGKAMEGTQPIPRIQTKTKLDIVFGGKSMAGVGGKGRVQSPTGEESN